MLGFELASQIKNDEKIDLKKVGSAAAGGAVSGAIAGATGGLGAAVGGGAAGATVKSSLDAKIDGKDLTSKETLKKVATDTVAGAILGGVGGKIGEKAGKGLTKKLFEITRAPVEKGSSLAVLPIAKQTGEKITKGSIAAGTAAGESFSAVGGKAIEKMMGANIKQKNSPELKFKGGKQPIGPLQADGSF